MDMTQKEAEDTALRIVEQAMRTAHPNAMGRILRIETAVYALAQSCRMAASERHGPDHPMTLAYRAIAEREASLASEYTERELARHLPPVSDRPILEPADAAGVTYGEKVPDFADLMTIEEFREHVDCGSISSRDGSAYAVRDGKESRDEIDVHAIPASATHVAWYNK